MRPVIYIVFSEKTAEDAPELFQMFGKLIEKASDGKYGAESAKEILHDRSTLNRRIPQVAEMMKCE